MAKDKGEYTVCKKTLLGIQLRVQQYYSIA